MSSNEAFLWPGKPGLTAPRRVRAGRLASSREGRTQTQAPQAPASPCPHGAVTFLRTQGAVGSVRAALE